MQRSGLILDIFQTKAEADIWLVENITREFRIKSKFVLRLYDKIDRVIAISKLEFFGSSNVIKDAVLQKNPYCKIKYFAQFLIRVNYITVYNEQDFPFYFPFIGNLRQAFSITDEMVELQPPAC